MRIYINDSIYKSVFQAEYNYGPKEEQIIKQNIIINLFQTVIVRMLQLIASGVAFLKGIKSIDMEDRRISYNQLLFLGGKSVKMKTPDGDVIDGMYLKASDFKDNIEKYFIVCQSIEEDGLLVKRFILKEGYPCQGDNVSEETSKLMKLLPFLFDDPSEEREYCLMMGLAGNNDLPIPDAAIGSHPTALVTGELGRSYPFYTRLAIGYLMRGCNVMMIDFRGNVDSTGRLTAHKTKLDMETAYQYLAEEHGVKNEDLLLHGHCTGAGPAADLAARRKGVSIILDRSFAKFVENILGDAIRTFPLLGRINFVISPIIRKIFPWIFDYDNSKNLQKIQGNIAIVMDRSDAFIQDKDGKEVFNPYAAITESEVMEQINSLPSDSKKVLRLLDSDVGHTISWIDDVIPASQFSQFLIDTGLARQVFSTNLHNLIISKIL